MTHVYFFRKQHRKAFLQQGVPTHSHSFCSDWALQIPKPKNQLFDIVYMVSPFLQHGFSESLTFTTNTKEDGSIASRLPEGVVYVVGLATGGLNPPHHPILWVLLPGIVVAGVKMILELLVVFRWSWRCGDLPSAIESLDRQRKQRTWKNNLAQTFFERSHLIGHLLWPTLESQKTHQAAPIRLSKLSVD